MKKQAILSLVLVAVLLTGLLLSLVNMNAEGYFYNIKTGAYYFLDIWNKNGYEYDISYEMVDGHWTSHIQTHVTDVTFPTNWYPTISMNTQFPLAFEANTQKRVMWILN